jgi:EmrB/QacA subfamily drug resistance transporter
VTADGDRRGLTSRRVVVLVPVLATFIAFLDVTAVNVAFPAMRRSFVDVSPASLSWVLNAYNIVFAALLVPAGRVADRVGRRRLFLVGLGVFCAASLVCAASQSPVSLVAGRAAQAVGAAIVTPSALGLLLADAPPSRRGSVVALLAAAAALAAVAGPALGGWLVDAWGWRAVFLVNVPIAVACLVIGRNLLRESREPAEGALPDLLGIVLLICAMAGISLGIVQANAWGWSGYRTVAVLVTAAVVLVLFVLRCDRHRAPAFELGLLRAPGVAAANAGMVVLAAAFYAKVLCDVLFLTSMWRFSLLETGLAVTPGALITACCAVFAGRVADRSGPRVPAVAGIVVYAAGCAWYAWRAGPDPRYVTDWLPGAVLTGTGMAFAFTSLTTAAVSALGSLRLATGSAINATARQLGAVLGVSALVAVIGVPAAARVSLAAFHHAWVYIAVTALVAAAVATQLPRQVAAA